MLRFALLSVFVLALFGAAAQSLPLEVRANCTAVGANVQVVFQPQADHLQLTFTHQGKVNRDALLLHPLYKQLSVELLSKFQGNTRTVQPKIVRQFDSLVDAHAEMTLDSILLNLTNPEAQTFLAMMKQLQVPKLDTIAFPVRITLDGYSVSVMTPKEAGEWAAYRFSNPRPSEMIYQLMARSFDLYRRRKGKDFLENRKGFPFTQALPLSGQKP